MVASSAPRARDSSDRTRTFHRERQFNRHLLEPVKCRPGATMRRGLGFAGLDGRTVGALRPAHPCAAPPSKDKSPAAANDQTLGRATRHFRDGEFLGKPLPGVAVAADGPRSAGSRSGPGDGESRRRRVRAATAACSRRPDRVLPSPSFRAGLATGALEPQLPEARGGEVEIRFRRAVLRASRRRPRGVGRRRFHVVRPRILTPRPTFHVERSRSGARAAGRGFT